jgi:hypothetical protein
VIFVTRATGNVGRYIVSHRLRANAVVDDLEQRTGSVRSRIPIRRDA